MYTVYAEEKNYNVLYNIFYIACKEIFFYLKKKNREPIINVLRAYTCNPFDVHTCIIKYVYIII